MLGGGNQPPGGGGGLAGGMPARRMSAADTDSLLPKYDPQSNFSRREVSRSRSAEKAIHIIPVFLVFCALILWMFSTPPHVNQASDVGGVIPPLDSGGSEVEHPPSVGSHAAVEVIKRRIDGGGAVEGDGGGD